MRQKMANELRFLCADMVQRANSGHPGAPMGLAEVIVALSEKLRHNPRNPQWLNRDRLVFSGGHASSLVYAFLHLTGYDVSLDDLKNFRQFGSKTPGHPEITTPGVEIATGPLGQGFANAVGFAMAGKSAAHLLGDDVIDHKVYCICGDGDLMEGISYEAAALAGLHALDNLVVIFDSNDITIEGATSIATSESVKARFEAAGWEVATINGHDLDEIEFALDQRKEKPYLIIARTKIARGAPGLEGSEAAHGAPLGEAVIRAGKKAAGLDENAQFAVSEDVRFAFGRAVELGDLHEARWEAALPAAAREKIAQLQAPDFSRIAYPDFAGAKVATRDSNGKILNAIAAALPGFIGGSADLAPSNKTQLKSRGDFPCGANIHFGVREHAMAAVCNAYARYGLFLPFSATFFIFSDYLKAGARMAALMGLRHFFIWTHDSIGVGEDGPTHQPIEQLATFRAMPGFYTFRPADGNENVECWKVALGLNAPSGFVLSRQSLAALGGAAFGSVANGGYVVREFGAGAGVDGAGGAGATSNSNLAGADGEKSNLVSGNVGENGANSVSNSNLAGAAGENAEKNAGETAQFTPQITLLASGSEVGLCVAAAEILAAQGVAASVASVPCYELFAAQGAEYRARVLRGRVLAVEAASGAEWFRFADDVLGMSGFGESAPAGRLFEHFGFTPQNIAARALALLGR